MDIDFFDQCTKFKNKRIDEISKNNTLLAIQDGPKIIIHIIPKSCLDKHTNYPISKKKLDSLDFKPICPSNNTTTISSCVLAYGKNNESEKNKCYTKICNNGIIEGIDTDTLEPIDGKFIPTVVFEERLTYSIINYIRILKELKVNTPLLVFITLLDADDYQIRFHGSKIPLKKELTDYHIFIDNFEEDIDKKLKSYFKKFK